MPQHPYARAGKWRGMDLLLLDVFDTARGAFFGVLLIILLVVGGVILVVNLSQRPPPPAPSPPSYWEPVPEARPIRAKDSAGPAAPKAAPRRRA